MIRYSSLILRAVACILAAATYARAAEITGTLKDPTGKVASGAVVFATYTEGSREFSATTDRAGRFTLSNVPEGEYQIRVNHPGFKPYIQPVAVRSAAVSIEIQLALAEVRQQQDVTGKTVGLANSDLNYRKLRGAAIAETFAVENVKLTRDAGVITLRRGTVSFAAPVLGRVTFGVFSGDGEFTFAPILPWEKNHLFRITGKESVAENFDSAVLVFTDATYEEIRRSGRAAAPAGNAVEVLRKFRDRMRRRPENPKSFLEAFLTSESMENVEAELLAELYNPKRSPSFTAYLHGRKYNDLRLYLRPLGVFPQLPSPDEVAIVNVDPEGQTEGIWYLAHFFEEYEKSIASSHEDKRIVRAESYRIETVIGRDERLTAVADIQVRALREGERVIKFELLPNLRVTRVSDGASREIPYIQQDRREDGSFYVVMPEPISSDTTYRLVIEYHGDKVIEKAGGGSFSVRARTSWYPSLNAFNDRIPYDLTFKVPKRYTLVSVGKLVKEWTEADYAASHWVSEVPLAVAGFNYGEFRKKEIVEEKTKYAIEGYATKEVPDYLRLSDISGMNPTRLTEQALAQTKAAMQIFQHYFGHAPYGRIAITQQPEFSFGQSWPSLVYLPLSAFLDSTQRLQITGEISRSLTEFVAEVTPHEVAHQWWGHLVGWATYRDQWISEGFADFSAALYLQLTEKKPDKFIEFWDKSRKTILDKNQYGQRANDAGPVWMGIRLNSYRNDRAYSQLAYQKGGYILHMLRQMMRDPTTGDEAFRKMMHEFVEQHTHKNASTESFREVVTRHMQPHMDLGGDKTMDWFFRQWVYGNEIPKYKFTYTVTPEGGQFRLKGSLTQSSVSNEFRMRVPLYADLDGRIVGMGSAAMVGNSTLDDIEALLPVKPRSVMINAFRDVLCEQE